MLEWLKRWLRHHKPQAPGEEQLELPFDPPLPKLPSPTRKS